MMKYVCLLYEGKLISHFDHRFGSYQGQELVDNELSKLQHTDPLILSMPRYWVHSSYIPTFTRDKSVWGVPDDAGDFGGV
jgi:hypothetical protein